MAGLTGNINLIASGVQYALFIIFTTIMFFYIDRTGRRPLLIYGAIAMGVCHYVVGGILSAGEYVPGGVDHNPNVVIKVTGAKANTVIAFCYLLIIIYALTLAPVAWVYAAEVWSLETRATGMSISAIGNWLVRERFSSLTLNIIITVTVPQLTLNRSQFNFALGLYIPPGFISIRYGMFIIFGTMCMLAAVQFYFTYPETCNKTLEEIEELFAPDAPKPWKTKPGGSKLDALIADVQEKHLTIADVTDGKLGREKIEVETAEKV